MKRPKTNRALARATHAAQLSAGNIDAARTLLVKFMQDTTTKLSEVEKALLVAVDKVLESAQANADAAGRLTASQNVRGVR